MSLSDRVADVNDELAEDLEEEYGVNVDDEEEVVEESTSHEEEEDKFEIPEKFAAKSKEDIAKSYIELEKTLGRQSQEIGEHRKIIDNYLRQELDRAAEATSKSKEKEDDLSFDDLVENPKDALDRVVTKKMSSVEQRLDNMTREAAVKEFKNKHTDFDDIVKSRDFAEFVQASPYRMRLAKAADSYDLDAADDLLSAYRELRSAQKKKAEIEVKKKVKQELKDVAGESGSTNEQPKKVYRRSELIKLRIEDPEKFDAMYDDIARAYQEGRVK